ncbi:MAG: HIT family protein [Parvularculaceae bacterium]
MSLNEPYSPDNILAKIIRGEMPSIKVFENDRSLAIMDIFPQTEGHTLVIPKHVEATNLLTMDDAALAGFIVDVKKVAAAVEKAMAPDGVRIMQFNGAPAGQTIFHLHFHILPIFDRAPLGAHAGQKADTDKLEALAHKIRAAF